VGAFVAISVSLLIALIATPIAARVARRLGVVDNPGELKVHNRPVPYFGGCAVFLAIAPVVALERATWLLPLSAALLLGVVDDVRFVPPRVRLACELLIGIGAGFVIDPQNPVGVATVAVIVVALINAMNLLDGLDGLTASVGAVSAVGIALLGDAPAVPLALAGALAGFLVFNRPPARIYLGDGGAYLVGATLAMSIAYALQGRGGISYWLTAVLLVAIPLADTTIAIVRRMRARRPVFAGDRSHVYDQLVDRGQTPARAVVECAVLQSVLVGAAVLLWHLPETVAGILAGGILTALVVAAYFGGFITPGATS
jgi:UDP-N-acetylmuramyl pentapeptide phosphotransferase/UDP-N-acetylglucosamine-1-phosphate transferase